MTDSSKSSQKHKTVLGIDPGCGLTGVAVVRMFPQSAEVIDAFPIESPRNSDVGEKLKTLYDRVGETIKKYSPDLVGIESVFLVKNQKTAMEVSQGRGVVVLAAAQAGVPIINVTPPQVKMAVCSYGRASKEQVSDMVMKLFGLKKELKPDDVADAAAIAWTAYQLFQSEKARG